MDGKERFQILLNYEGKDAQVIVDDMDTAQGLLNDHDAAAKLLGSIDLNEVQGPLYFPTVSVDEKAPTAPTSSQQSQKNQKSELVGSAQSIPDNLPTNSSGATEPSEPSTRPEIWTKKKPTEIDLEATSQLLKLRQKMAIQFDDRKTIKSKLWNNIATSLKKQFNMGENAAEKCRQKFANLQRMYLLYIKHQKTTGTERNDDFPPFFDELHSILGSKDKANPVFLEDSMEVANNKENICGSLSDSLDNQDVISESGAVGKQGTKEVPKNNSDKLLSQPSTSRDHVDRFKSTRKKMKPAGKSEAILEALQADSITQEDQFALLQKHLKKTEEQREKFLNIMEAAFSRKREREEVTSSSDSD